MGGITELVDIKKEYLDKLFYSLTIELVGGVIYLFRNAKFFDDKQIKNSNENRPHKDIEIVKGKNDTVNILCETLGRAKEGDTIFGHCNSCTNYNESFYTELTNAIIKNVKIIVIVKETPDLESFIIKLFELKKLKPDLLKIYTSNIQYIRIFGIKKQEVIFALPFKDDYIGIHISDKRVSQYFEITFDKILKQSKEIER